MDQAQPQHYSLSEVVRIALPPRSRFVVPADARHSHPNWAVLVGLPLRRESLIERGDLVLLLERMDSTDWVESIETLIEMGVSGVVALEGKMPEEAIEAARKASLPVALAPADTNLREVHRAVLTLMTNPQVQLSARKNELYGQFTRLIAEGASLEELVQTVVAMTGKNVLVQDKRLNPLANMRSERVTDDEWRNLMSRLSVQSALPEGWSDRRAAAETATVQPQHASDGWARLIAPIVAKDMARGYFSLIGREDEFDTLDTLVAEQAAMACAMEMARAKAVNDATKRWRGEFIDAVLSKSVPPQEIRLWARRIGYESEAPHAAVVWSWAEVPNRPSLRRLETIVNGEISLGRYAALLRAGEDQVAAFVTLDSLESIRQARQLADSVHHLANTEFPKVPMYCGIGRPVQGVSEWLVSHREAQQALLISVRLNSPRPLEFGNLSVHRLLFQLENHPELRSFCDEMLGALIRYDRAHNSNLVETLDAFFENHTNLSETAKALYIHRNTLQYRMDRVSQIAGFDLQNPERRLAMQLALKAYKLLPAETWGA